VEKMNMAEFLLGAGLGLLIVLLGWSEQITSKRKDTKELENEFLGKAKFKSEKYKEIISKGGATKKSFSNLVDFLYAKDRKDEDIEIFEDMKQIKADLKTLDRKYSWRFWVLLVMTACLFVSGGVNLYWPTISKKWILGPNLIFILLVFINLINVRLLENKYANNITKVMEKL
jgi:hypothetical protein